MSNYLELNSSLTADDLTLKEGVHRFAAQVLRPAAQALDRIADPSRVIAPDSVLWNVFRAAYTQGFHTALIPAACGGLGLAGLRLHIALEEMGWGSSEFALSLAVAGFPFAMVAGSGNQDLIDELVTPFVADREARWVGCWAITEPQHGSDHFAVGSPEFQDANISAQVTARADGDHFVLHGAKAAWISNGSIATHALTFLGLESGRGMSGGGVAFVPLDLPGVIKGPPLDKLGQRALNQGSIEFDAVRIPKRYLLVGAEAYEAVLRQTLVLTNAAMGAVFTGVARAAFEHARDYAKSRVQGGKSIREHQLVQKHLFDMFTRVETSRALSRAVLSYNATNPPSLAHAVAVKTYCTQACLEVTDTALQLFGGKGLSREFPLEKLYRDTRASLIEDGANDVLALVGARCILEAT